MLVNMKLEIKDYTSWLHALYEQLTFTGKAKTKLAMVSFLCCVCVCVSCIVCSKNSTVKMGSRRFANR